MQAQYLLRFDDICPTMNWDVWVKIEALLNHNNIKPILAVVPDNRDPKLAVAPPAADFWQRVRAWQARGWTIALHGYQHVYVNKNPGILWLQTPKSEFAGLPREVQKEKLLAGLAIFDREGVRADCWVAPSHSFDWTTVDLLSELGVKVISDGPWPWPHTDRQGVTWVPQQFWARLKAMPCGIWTTCYHHNSCNGEELARLRHDLEVFSSKITNLIDVVTRFAGRRLTMFDQVIARSIPVYKSRLRPIKERLLRKLSP
jgi:hypothetical protein